MGVFCGGALFFIGQPFFSFVCVYGAAPAPRKSPPYEELKIKTFFPLHGLA